MKKYVTLKEREKRRANRERNRKENWKELLNYCKFSANPVGRYVIDISYKIENQSEDNINKVYFASDNLCSALQILKD